MIGAVVRQAHAAPRRKPDLRSNHTARAARPKAGTLRMTRPTTSSAPRPLESTPVLAGQAVGDQSGHDDAHSDERQARDPGGCETDAASPTWRLDIDVRPADTFRVVRVSTRAGSRHGPPCPCRSPQDARSRETWEDDDDT